jgi:thiosulfate/3-mercaptopyruvate sulfurtransferase
VPGFKHYLLLITLILPGCSGDQQISDQGIIVSTDWLLRQMNDPSLVILYVGSKDTFDSIHIPGARYFPAHEIIINNDSLRHEIPPVEAIDSMLSVSGIDENSRLVLCYENERTIPVMARVFMTLDYVGFGGRTHVLNGGLAKWLEEDLPVTDTLTVFPVTDMDLALNGDFLVQAEDVMRYLESPDFVVLDARLQEYYTGSYDSIEQKFEGGHIEGSRNLPFDQMLSIRHPSEFLDNAGMIREFEKAGMDETKTAVHYCGSGVWAAVNYLASVHLGYKAVFYDGSYEDWENKGLPVIKPVRKNNNTD